MKVGVLAAGQTAFGVFRNKNMKHLFYEAYKSALNSVDYDIDVSSISEGFIGNLGVGGSQLGNSAALLMEHIGLTGVSSRKIENACASSGFAFLDGFNKIKNGAEVVLVGGVEVMNDLNPAHKRYWLGVSGDTEWERSAGCTFSGIYALMAKRHMFEYGTSREALATCAVKNHYNGYRNPKAHFQKEITLEKVLSAPMIAEPLGLYDCCPTSDGASVVILASEEVTRKLTDDPIWVSGVAGASDYLAIHDRESITSLRATKIASREALKQAKLGIADISLAEVHDCFTIAEIMAIEDLGFYEKGKAEKAVIEGETRLNGNTPINSSGGLKSKGHPLGATGTGQIVELFKQLQGKAGKRQVEDVENALSHNVGGSGATCTVSILSR